MNYLDIKPSTFNAAKRDDDARKADHATSVAQQVAALEKAAAVYAQRCIDRPRDSFNFGKADTCLDLAAKLERFGSFVSDAQEAFAAKLVLWAQPREMAAPAAPQTPSRAPAEAPAPAAKPALCLPKLFDLMQRLSKLHIGKLTIARKNQDSLCWLKWEGVEKVVGKIDGGQVTLWNRPGVALIDIHAELVRIEADPEAAAVLHGKASGCCSVCNRDLTDPESIERGIGPVCAGKF